MKHFSLEEIQTGDVPSTVLNAYERLSKLAFRPANVLASFDWGYWGIKAFGPSAPEGKTFRSIYGTHTREFGWANNDLMNAASNGIGLVNEVMGVDMLFGQAAANRAEKATLKRKEHGSLNDLLPFFQAALSQITFPGDSRLWVVVGLPVADSRNPEYTASVKEMLTGIHEFTTVEGSKHTILVEKVNIQPQPAGAIFDATIDQRGVATDYLDKVQRNPVCVFAIGGETAEVYVTRPVRDDDGNWYVEPDLNRSGSRFRAGINILHQYMLDTVWSGLTMQQRPDPAKIDELVTVGKWYDGYIDVDLTPYIAQGARQMSAAALSVLADTVGLDNTDIRFMFAVGGSVELVQDAVIEAFGRHRVFLPGEKLGEPLETRKQNGRVEHPERIIARGLYRYGLFTARRWMESKGLKADE